MKFLKLLIVFTLVLTSCQQNENLVDEQNPLSEIIDEAEGAFDGESDNDNDEDESDNSDNDNNGDNGDNGDNSDNGSDSDNNGDNTDEGSDNDNNGNTGDNGNGQDGNNPEEETPGPPRPIDCSIYDGTFEFTVRNKQFVGVKTLGITDIVNGSVKWTINGTEVTPRSPRFVLIEDHIQQSGTVEVCYEAESPKCGKFSDCITVNFVKQ
ncbi:hypothetical protein [uncultured Tenacibaculum sp.]|uniref:hypothetical protein n=1 Tax=uncultured Tenacibaculum sp. TaxID=174713 RepID=UPI0026167BD2|nr:hypothetical protein [uncultured Tenacibaculum sp.]